MQAQANQEKAVNLNYPSFMAENKMEVAKVAERSHNAADNILRVVPMDRVPVPRDTCASHAGHRGSRNAGTRHVTPE